MLYNFNYKKFFKYCFYVLCIIFLFNSCNAKAWSNLDSQFVVNYDTEDDIPINQFLIRGGVDDLDDYLEGEFLPYYNRVKVKVASDLGYSSFDNFADDYYYITDVWLTPPSYSTRYVQLSFFYCLKSSPNASLFNLSISTTIRRSSTPTSISSEDTYYTQFGAIYRTSAYYFYQQFEHLDSVVFDSVTANSFAQQVMTCTNSSTYCHVDRYESDTKTLTIDFRQASDRFLHYVDTNKSSLDLFFAKVNAMLVSNDYVFQKATLFSNDNVVYDLITPIATNVLSVFVPNNSYSQSLPRDSKGITVGSLGVALDGHDGSDSFGTICSNNRPFINGVCYFYGSDMTENALSNTNYFPEITYYFSSGNSFRFGGNYKIVSFRVYTSQNLQLQDVFLNTYNFGNENLRLNVIDQRVVDYSLYRDYYVVFEIPSYIISNDEATSISFVFSSLSNFGASLSSDYTLGAYDTIKITTYNEIPTSTDIDDEITNDPISSISSTDNGSSYFSNFRVNEHGLSSIVLYPVNFVRSFSSYTCSPVVLPIPHIGNFTLPCISSFMTINFNTIWTLYKLIINGFICYRLLISLYASIKNAYNPDNDRIEVADL